MVKNPPAKAGDMSLIPGSGRSPGRENGNRLQYFCLENPMDRGNWQATTHRVTKTRTRLKWLSLCIQTFSLISACRIIKRKLVCNFPLTSQSLCCFHGLSCPLSALPGTITGTEKPPSLLASSKQLHSTVGKESTCNAGDLGLIPGLGRSPGEGIGYPL